METYPVIIVGAGIGGLTTAAYLSKLGIPSLLLEQTNLLGGRCSTRVINGKRYEIGALYVGGGVFDNLRQTFDVSCPSIPVTCGIKIGDQIVSFPVGLRTRYMYTKSPTLRHKSLNPEYLFGGNARIASLLFNVAQKNCTVVFGAPVNKILVSNGCVEGVETTEGKYSGQVIVCNAGLKPTVLDS